jgi:hypothetical protein
MIRIGVTGKWFTVLKSRGTLHVYEDTFFDVDDLVGFRGALVKRVLSIAREHFALRP